MCVGVVVLAGCQASPAPGASCARAADCGAPLVCRFGRCRAECSEARDCPIGARCIGSAGAGVCTLDVENHCTASICPSPLQCVADQCRTLCTTTADCLAGACEGTTCVEPLSGIDASVPLDAPAPDAGQSPDTGGSDGGPLADADLDAGMPGDTGIGPDCRGVDCAGRVVISEIAAGRNFFVELYVTGTGVVDLTGCTIAWTDGAGTETPQVLPTAVLGSHSYYLFSSNTLAVTDLSPTGPFPIGTNDGSVSLSCGGTTLDLVGWGAATAHEGTALPNWTSGSLERKAMPSSTVASMSTGGADELAGNADDTNDNASDFVNRVVPEPQTSASITEP